MTSTTATSLEERWGCLNLATTDPAILVLDATESAMDCRSQILTLARAVLDRLPARLPRRLFFLGHRKEYPVEFTHAQASQWFAENSRRPSLITPIFETLADTGSFRLVVIGSGLVFDWEDWLEHPLLEQTRLASLRQPLAAPGAPPQILAPEAQDIVAHLFNPAERVTLSGPGFLPFFWDSPEFHIETDGSDLRLTGSAPANEQLHVGFLVLSGGRVRANITRTHGPAVLADLSDNNPRQVSPPRLATLTPAETERFRLAASRQPFTCPHCAQAHRWDTIRCKQDGESILGHCVYPSIPEDTVGLLCLEDIAGEIAVYHPGCGVLRLAHDLAVVGQGGGARLYQFQACSARWLPQENRTLTQYYQQSSNQYVVVL